MMKKLILGLLALMSFSAFAGEYLFKIQEYDQPHMLKIETTEDNLNLKFFQVYDSRDGKVLFELKGIHSFKESDEQMYSEIEGESHVTLEDSVVGLTCVEELLQNPWGDTTISKEFTYAISVRLEITKGKIIGGRLEIANNDQEEMAMWGDLVLQD